MTAPTQAGAPSAAGARTVHASRLAYLDGWRGVSILAVLIGHFLPKDPVGVATLGVELFFVLSGRLMAEILFVERFPLPEFFKRRISRIYPGVFAFVLLTWVAARGSELAFKPSAALAALTFTLNYAMALHHGVAAIENLWSLCIEEHAYLLLGLVALLARRRWLAPERAILAVAALSVVDGVVCTAILGQTYRQVYWRTDAHLFSIFAAAWAFLAARRLPAPSWLSPVAFAAGLAAALGPDWLRYSLGTALFSISIATLGEGPAAVRRALSWRPLALVGLWSYSLYLWQQPFFRLQLTGRLEPWLAVGLALAAGLASFYLVEQPARRWLNRHWRVRRAPNASEAAPAPIGAQSAPGAAVQPGTLH